MPAHNDVAARRVWRVVFIGVHVAFMVKNASALVSAVRQRALTEVAPERYPGIMFMDRWGTFGRLTMLAAGVYLAALMARGDQRVPRYYVRYAVVFLAFEWILSLSQLTLLGIPRGTSWASYVLQMTAYAAALVTWVTYVWRSRTMRATFVGPPWTMGRMSRLMVGLGALALIIWPLVLNSYVETMSALPAWISPKATDSGMGLTEGILLMSVGSGLFILMKNACRMRNAWIAVLLPVSLVVLFYALILQAFAMHYGHEAAEVGRAGFPTAFERD